MRCVHQFVIEGDFKVCTLCQKKYQRCIPCRKKKLNGELSDDVWVPVAPLYHPAPLKVIPPYSPIPEAWAGIPDPIPDQRSILARDPNPVPPFHWSWSTRHKVKRAYIGALETLAKGPTPSVSGEGDGVVYVGGDGPNGQYGFMVAVAIRRAREVGYTGPIEWWYDSCREWVRESYYEGMGDVRVRDLRSITPIPHEIRGWHGKPLAVAHSSFRRVLMLDADAILTRPPRSLFESVTEEHPLTYWMKGDCLVDPARCCPWGKRYISNWGVQGGQLVFDRVAGAKLLLLFRWINSHSLYYDPRHVSSLARSITFGDEDTYTIALAALSGLGEPYRGKGLGVGVVKTLITVEYSHQDKVYITHYAGNKIHRGNWKPAGDAVGDRETARAVILTKYHSP